MDLSNFSPAKATWTKRVFQWRGCVSFITHNQSTSLCLAMDSYLPVVQGVSIQQKQNGLLAGKLDESNQISI
jgi:hypothetical protein